MISTSISSSDIVRFGDHAEDAADRLVRRQHAHVGDAALRYHVELELAQGRIAALLSTERLARNRGGRPFPVPEDNDQIVRVGFEVLRIIELTFAGAGLPVDRARLLDGGHDLRVGAAFQSGGLEYGGVVGIVIGRRHGHHRTDGGNLLHGDAERVVGRRHGLRGELLGRHLGIHPAPLVDTARNDTVLGLSLIHI